MLKKFKLHYVKVYSSDITGAYTYKLKLIATLFTDNWQDLQKIVKMALYSFKLIYDVILYRKKLAMDAFKLVYDLIFILWKIQEMGRKLYYKPIERIQINMKLIVFIFKSLLCCVFCLMLITTKIERQ